jgi:hypothetical protein
LAVGLSVKPGGVARRIEIAGGLVTHGRGMAPMEIYGEAQSLGVAGLLARDDMP